MRKLATLLVLIGLSVAGGFAELHGGEACLANSFFFMVGRSG